MTTGQPAADTVMLWCGLIVAAAAASALVWRIVRFGLRVARVLDQILPLLRVLDQIAEDWAGVPDRPGVPGRPGLIQRMSGLESTVQILAAVVDRIDRRTRWIDEAEGG